MQLKLVIQKFYLTSTNDEKLLLIKEILKLALPAIGSTFLMLAYNLIDLGFIGQLGAGAVAAVGSAGFFLHLGWAFSSIIIVGAGIKISHAVGIKDKALTNSYIKTSINSMLILSILFFGVVLSGNSSLIGFFNLHDETVELAARQYLIIVSLGGAFTLLNFLFTNIMIAHGTSKQPFYFNAIGIGLNILLDPIFIFVFNWGVEGAAFATVISQILVFVLFLKKSGEIISLSKLKWEISKNKFWQIIKLGFSPALQRVVFSVVAIIMARIISNWGTTAIAVQKVGVQIEAIFFMMAAGFGTAISSLSGQAFGAGNYTRQWNIYKIGFFFVAIIGLFSSILFISYPEQVFSIIINEPESVQMGAGYLRILGYSQIFMCLELLSTGAFYGWGRTFAPAAISMTLTGLRIPMALFLIASINESINSAWWSISISSIAKGIITTSLFIYLIKKFLLKNIHMKTNNFNIAANKTKGNIWLKGLFGIEKENLRVNKDGTLALTPHPTVFENKLNHAYITTDFSESQVEMITPPLPKIEQSLNFLNTIQDIVSKELKDEYLWPQSLAPILPNEKDIPIARYSIKGIEQYQYRELLAEKYGKKKQMFSGIHFNFSFDESLLKKLHVEQNTKESYEKFRENAYLKTVRQLSHNRWLYILLFGYSPVNHETNLVFCPNHEKPIIEYKNRTSIRNSCFGYTNMEELFPDYNSVKNYQDSIEKMIAADKISSSKELYAPARIKFEKGSNRISYLELRFIDIDPTEKNGITQEQLHFLHWLAIYGLLSNENSEFDNKQQHIANLNHNLAALNGLGSDFYLYDIKREKVNGWQKAKEIMKNMLNTFNEIRITDANYSESLASINQLIEAPVNRKIHKIIDEINQQGYINYHINKAMEYDNSHDDKDFTFKGYEDMELSTQLLLKEAVKKGIQFEIIDRKENFIKLTKGNNAQYLQQATKTSLDSYANILAMENKVVTKHILKENNIATPVGKHYNSTKEAISDYSFFESKVVVVKPKQTNFGKGITIFNQDYDKQAFKLAINNAFSHDSSVIVEEYIEGKEYRFFVIDDEVVGILHRVPANVTGDGKHSIKELVMLKNQSILRGKGYKTPLEKISLGQKEIEKLKSQGKDINYIPQKDEVVYLRNTSNISTGGDSIDYTDDIDESYKKIAVKAAKALNVKITGLDMIIKDYKQPASDTNYSIIELNFNPAIHIHCFPFKGKNRKLDAKILDALGY